MRESLRTARTVVVKIGTSSLLDERGLLDLPVVSRHLLDLVALDRAGVRGILVTSGAIGAGCAHLGFAARPTTIPELQATAAVGQSLLMNIYNTVLAPEGWVVAQMLLTHDDFQDRQRYLNLKNTLASLHGRPALPVINENDTVAVEEIRFGDNDALAALVAGMVGADVTVLFTDVDGFHLGGRKLDVVTDITPEIEAAAGPGSGRGGMASKLRAAAAITQAGGSAVIAHGKRDRVADILRGEPRGTLFTPRGSRAPRAGRPSDPPQQHRTDTRALALRARDAARVLRTLPSARKDAALLDMAAALRAGREAIERANRLDLAAGLPAALAERLRVDVEAIARSLEAVAALPDPVGHVEQREAPGGFALSRRRVPIGVILMIFESRPNVTPEAGALCLKSGNAAILKGGSEARHTNQAMLAAMEAAIPPGAIQLVDGGHAAVAELLRMDDLIDLVIPRGGEALIRAVAAQSRIPVLKHDRGNCHVYVDAAADLDMAERILENAKCQRPATCNAAEKVLVHERVAAAFVPRLSKLGVELRGDARACALAPMTPATDADWEAEYLDRVLGVKIVASLEEAIAHIERWGSHHTDAIVTADESVARRFLDQVDSASVMWNASTRLADGAAFGLGAEVGISTERLHARGPMGLEELNIYKWVVEGDGHLRS